MWITLVFLQLVRTGQPAMFVNPFRALSSSATHPHSFCLIQASAVSNYVSKDVERWRRVETPYEGSESPTAYLNNRTNEAESTVRHS